MAGSRSDTLRVGLFKQPPDILGAGRLFQCLAERVVPQLAGNALQGPQVIARPIGRRHEQEEQMHVFAVESRKVDAVSTDGRSADQAVDALVTALTN